MRFEQIKEKYHLVVNFMKDRAHSGKQESIDSKRPEHVIAEITLYEDAGDDYFSEADGGVAMLGETVVFLSQLDPPLDYGDTDDWG